MNARHRRDSMAAIITTPEGVVRPGEIYQKGEFLQRVGLKETGFRTARRNGLQVVYTGGKCFVRGADWAAYLDRVSADCQPVAQT
jgi:hypothetical protein